MHKKATTRIRVEDELVGWLTQRTFSDDDGEAIIGFSNRDGKGVFEELQL